MLNDPLRAARWLVLLVPAALLGGAYIGQYFFHLTPCEMCWWQRYPHFAALALGLIPAQKPADHDPMTPEIVHAMTALHFQMQPALQIFLQHFDIPEGRGFRGEDWGGWLPA